MNTSAVYLIILAEPSVQPDANGQVGEFSYLVTESDNPIFTSADNVIEV